MRTVIFFSIFLSIFAIMNLYIHYRFVKKLLIPDTWKFVGVTLLVILFLCQLLYAFTFRFDILPGAFYLILGSTIGFSFMIFTIAVGYDLFRTTGSFILREHFGVVRLYIDAAALFLLVVYLTSGLIGGLKDPRWVQREVPFPLPSIFPSLKIVQVSDVHVGHVIKRPFVERMVSRINSANPDIVVITGDLVDLDPDRILEDLEPLRNIKSRYGVFFCSGNHEYFHKPVRTLEVIAGLGITVLDDESVTLKDESGREFLNMIGLRDIMGRRMDLLLPDPQKAFSEANSTLPSIVLAHQPVWVNELDSYNYNLMLSGHTHGGQIFPFSYLVYLAQPFLKGLHKTGEDRYLYISSGTGFWGPPIRVIAPSEITEITLKPSGSQSMKAVKQK